MRALLSGRGARIRLWAGASALSETDLGDRCPQFAVERQYAIAPVMLMLGSQPEDVCLPLDGGVQSGGS